MTKKKVSPQVDGVPSSHDIDRVKPSMSDPNPIQTAEVAPLRRGAAIRAARRAAEVINDACHQG